MTEKREYVRVPLRLEAQWNGSARNYPAVTSDLSFGGCYIESIDKVNIGNILNLQLKLPSNRILTLQGEVRYSHPTIGFGIQFVEVPALQQTVLAALIRKQTIGRPVANRALEVA
jgi:hypothetical protein